MRFLFFLACLFISFKSFTSDIKSVSVLTDQIIVLHFSDGYIEYHGYHQTGGEDKTIKDELDVQLATDVLSYSIISANDKDFHQPVHPVKAGRKSKPSGMSMKCMPNDKSLCMSDYVMDHFIYLFLTKPLKPNKNYILNTGNLAKNSKNFNIQYHPAKTRSLAVHVNQLGFVPSSPVKIAYISHWMGDAGPLELEDMAPVTFKIQRVKDGETIFTGTVTKQKDFETGTPDGPTFQSPNGNFVATDVWQCDFSDFKKPGEYVVSVDRMGTSFPFRIHEDVYREAFIQTCRSLYHHRSGIALKEPFTKYEREAPHNPNITPDFKLRYTRFRNMDSHMESHTLSELEAMFDDSFDTRNIWGWYQDAGDWDAYISHAVIPAFLMTTFELKPDNFSDGELNIPESGNGIPDILDEAGWLLNHYRRAKGPTGGIAGGRIEGDNYPAKEAGHGLPSYEDIRKQWIVYAEEPRLTFIYARLAAQMAYNYKIAAEHKRLSGNINFMDSIEIWKAESLKAYNWAQDNLRDGDEEKIKANRANAEAWLYKLTQEPKWVQKFVSDLEISSANISKFNDYKWGVWAYVTSKSADSLLKADLIKAAELYARQEVTNAIEQNRSFRMGGNLSLKVEVGQATTPLVMPAIMAWETTHKPEFLHAVYSTCDYMLGGNQLDMTWITGVGKQSPTQVFNMDWWYNKKGIKEIVPGIVPYGPTADCDWMPGKEGDCNAYDGGILIMHTCICIPIKVVGRFMNGGTTTAMHHQAPNILFIRI
ncbi:MAG: hypothetical protein HC906_09935 [Bacteroidales bacterium]|nr:hypothetical protein [Bacteroidales bacterium]